VNRGIERAINTSDFQRMAAFSTRVQDFLDQR
jgi:hypothetical protein